MKQTGVPNLAPKIVDVQPEGPQEMHHAYFAKYTKALGIVHIICGVVNMVAAAFITKAFNSVDHVDDATEATEATAMVTEATYERVWPSILFLASGVFSILAARKRSKCLGCVA